MKDLTEYLKKVKAKSLGFDIDNELLLKNCTEPELGLHIFKSMNNQELKLEL